MNREADQKLEQLTDADLVLAVKIGISKVFEELIRRYAIGAKGVIAGIVRERSDVEDILQDALLISFRSIGNLKQLNKFPSWLYSIARFQAYRFLRTKKRIEIKAPRTGEPDVQAIASNTPDPAAIYDRNEEIRALHHSIRILPECYRQVLELKYWNNMKIKDIAVFLDISESNVKWRLHNGKIILRRLLANIFS